MSRSDVATPIERIGTCELCGATDHHLIEGLCPWCRPKTVTVDPAVARLPGYPDVPLGAEADVRHARVPGGPR